MLKEKVFPGPGAPLPKPWKSPELLANLRKAYPLGQAVPTNGDKNGNGGSYVPPVPGAKITTKHLWGDEPRGSEQWRAWWHTVPHAGEQARIAAAAKAGGLSGIFGSIPSVVWIVLVIAVGIYLIKKR